MNEELARHGWRRGGPPRRGRGTGRLQRILEAQARTGPVEKKPEEPLPPPVDGHAHGGTNSVSPLLYKKYMAEHKDDQPKDD